LSGHLEDTGDWPFRESNPFRLPAEPEPEREEEARAPVVAETDVEEAVPEPLHEAIDERVEVEEAEPEPVASAAEPSEPESLSEEPEPVVEEDEPAAFAEPAAELEAVAEPVVDEDQEPAEELAPAREHAEGDLDIPAGYGLLEGAPTGERRTVAIVVGRFNGDLTNLLLESALDELEEAGVSRQAITIMPVPGAFELPLAAMALAKTRRYACVIALGCVIRGETPHFDFVASEAASGLQLAAIETGVPVSFGVLTCENREQAEARVGKGAEAVRAGLEMADLFARLRAEAAASR
jgi:6,7-dimethyl-8-ribityllumazine synthase